MAIIEVDLSGINYEEEYEQYEENCDLDNELPEDVKEEITALIEAAIMILPYSRLYFNHWSFCRRVTLSNKTFEVVLEQGAPYGYILWVDNNSKNLVSLTHSAETNQWEGFEHDKWKLPIFDRLLLMIKMNAFDTDKQLERHSPDLGL